ncbi:hypothetical protein ABW19_dt0210625 [Dactylella cylindrospora]|nr:hypothetical protein ABW19_dt0210625 [Dactylella cylindrospora]
MDNGTADNCLLESVAKQGISFTTSYASIKSLLTLPSAPSAHRSFTHHLTTLSSITTPLTALTSLTILTSYLISPPHRQHPYLVFISLLPIISLGYDFTVLRPQVGRMEELVRVNGEKGVNGEELRDGMVEFERGSWGVTGLLGVAFGMGVVGIWGDSV